MTVTRLARDCWQSFGPTQVPLGDCAAVRIGGVEVVLIANRTQALGLELFTNVGIDPRQRRIVELRYGFGGETTSLEAIGKELGLTRERVRQLERDALDRLQRELHGVVSTDDLASAA